jgi:CheY-like chemotaxis protein/HPt (histidine-containing phosphotransfer) domain-containing protein
VALATDGLQAVTLLSGEGVPPDLVLMDVQMPEMDGLEATRRLRAMPGLKDLPIVGVTANAGAADRQECLAAGMNEHIGKPFDLSHLLAVILNHTGRRACPSDVQVPVSDSASEPPPVSADSYGVDVKGALRRLGEDRDLYYELLSGLVRDLRTWPDQVRSYITHDNALQASRLFHKIKGSAGTLGVSDLYDAAGSAERDLAGEPSGPASLAVCERALTVMIECLPRLEELCARWEASNLRPQTEVQAEAPLRPAQLLALRSLLVRNDLEALSAVKLLGLAARPCAQPWGQVLEQAVAGLNFSGALSALDGLESHLAGVHP